MKLSTFQITNVELILRKWVSFSRTIQTDSTPLVSVGLRDHAEQMIRVIAEDLLNHQSQFVQREKSQGLAVSNRS